MGILSIVKTQHKLAVRSDPVELCTEHKRLYICQPPVAFNQIWIPILRITPSNRIRIPSLM